MRTKYFFVRSPQAFWLSSAPGVLCTLVTSVVLCSLTQATLMSPAQDETRACGYVHSEFIQCSAPAISSTLTTSVVLYSLTRDTLISPGQDETRVCRYVRSEFIHGALWRILMRTKHFFFSFNTSILAKPSTWCFENSGNISCSLLVNPSHTDESWAGRSTCIWIYNNVHSGLLPIRQ